MTSISAASTSAYQSPLQKLQAELQSQVTSGAVSSSGFKAKGFIATLSLLIRRGQRGTP